MEKIGIDAHKIATQVCILTDEGESRSFASARNEMR
jgi:hypothetical protein